MSGTLDGDKECSGEAFYCGFIICIDTCDLDLYFEYLKTRDFFIPSGATVRHGPRVCKNAQIKPVVGRSIQG